MCTHIDVDNYIYVYGCVTVAELGAFLSAFVKATASVLRPLLSQWSRAGKSKSNCVSIVRAILMAITSCRVSGFGPYKQKKCRVPRVGGHRTCMGSLRTRLDLLSLRRVAAAVH